MHPLSWGAQTEKIRNFFTISNENESIRKSHLALKIGKLVRLFLIRIRFSNVFFCAENFSNVLNKKRRKLVCSF